MKTIIKLGVLALSLAAVANSQANIITLFNTGVDAFGNPLPDGFIGDPHYSLYYAPPGSTTTTEIRTSAGGFPISNGAWLGDNNLSTWIGPSNDHLLDGPGGAYDYRITFTLSGLNPSTAAITGRWATDNTGSTIILNSVDTHQTIPYGAGSGSYSFQNWSTFTLSSGFHSGLNTIDFWVYNGNDAGDTTGPTGLRVEMSGTASPVPEASTIIAGALLLLPFGAGAIRAMRKNVTA